jgi:oligopeptide transport system ATP-binding protein
MAQAVCREKLPPLLQLGTRASACHFAEELASRD